MPTDVNPASGQRLPPPAAPPPPASSQGSGVGARAVTVALGVWLLLSAFLLPHSAATRVNTWVVGLLCAAFGLWAFRAPLARFLDTALSLWLFFSTLTLFHRSETTLWNNLIAALLLFVASLIPSRGMGPRERQPPRLVGA